MYFKYVLELYAFQLLNTQLMYVGFMFVRAARVTKRVDDNESVDVDGDCVTRARVL